MIGLQLLAAFVVGAAPNDAWIEEGRNLAHRQVTSRNAAARLLHRKVESTLAHAASPETRSLGEWFNGRDMNIIEQAIWVNERFLGRWLGFRAEREGWSPDEVASRWGSAAERLDGRTAFAVSLAAYPKQAAFGLGDDGETSTSDLRSLSFQLVVDGRTIPIMISRLAEFQAKKRDAVESIPWWKTTPLNEALSSPADPEVEDLPPLGPYHRTIYWIESAPIGPTSDVELVVRSAKKTRRAKWASDYPGWEDR